METDFFTLITERELAAGLALFGTEASAREVAARVYAIPPEERVHYGWIDTALYAVACVSEELEARILEHLAEEPEDRAWFAGRLAEMKSLLRSPDLRRYGATEYGIEDVLVDDRIPQSSLGVFLEEELAAALALVAPDENARAVAAGVFAIPQEEQVHYEWTRPALMLLSCVTEDAAERARMLLGRSVPEGKQIAREQAEHCAHIRGAPRRDRALALRDVIHDLRAGAENPDS